MLISALFDPASILVLVIILVMSLVSWLWVRTSQIQFDRSHGALGVIRLLARDLAADHPLRRRVESAPVVELSFEEIAKILTPREDNGSAERAKAVEAAVAMDSLVKLRDRIAWIERFSQYAVHLGILGTVFALVSSDPTDLDAFRANLPLALGTTFWGLVGALLLSTLSGWAETLLDRAAQLVDRQLLEGWDTGRIAGHPLILPSVPSDRGDADSTLIDGTERDGGPVAGTPGAED